MIYIGIDPGKQGGIAWFKAGVAHARKMPDTEMDIVMLLGTFASSPEPATVLLESLAQLPRGKDGKAMQSPKSVRVQATNYGVLRGVVQSSGMPLDDVTAITWQREFGLVTPKGKNHTQTQKKNLHKQKAQQLFPHIKITHAIADALLITEYLRRRETANSHD